MDFSAINKIAKEPFLPKKSMLELDDNCTYQVTKVRSVNSRYGFSVVVTIDSEFQVFIPKRVSAILEGNKPMLNTLIQKAEARELFLLHIKDRTFEFV